MSLLDVPKVPEEPKTPVSVFDDKDRNKVCQESQNVDTPAETTQSIIQYLLAQGLNMDQIIMPGGGKDSILYLSENFNTPLEGLEDYI